MTLATKNKTALPKAPQMGAEARSPLEGSPPGASHGPSLWPKTRLARGWREGEGVPQEDREERLSHSYLSCRFMAKPGALGYPSFMQI